MSFADYLIKRANLQRWAKLAQAAGDYDPRAGQAPYTPGFAQAMQQANKPVAPKPAAPAKIPTAPVQAGQLPTPATSPANPFATLPVSNK